MLTNASGGPLFAKKMEENLGKIREVFPFQEMKGSRLMPVFLFRTQDEYWSFCTKVTGMSTEAAERSGGHAWRDYYATWYEAPNDPTHIHEQTHQLFGNRLFLEGGGSWFQEGVAEYVESNKNDLNAVASLIAKGRHMPLVDFVQLESLLHSSEEERASGGSEAADLYHQAALFVEFLRESKWGKGKFESFLQTLGHAPDGNLQRIRDGFLKVYGVSLEEIDGEFRKYCGKR